MVYIKSIIFFERKFSPSPKVHIFQPFSEAGGYFGVQNAEFIPLVFFIKTETLHKEVSLPQYFLSEFISCCVVSMQ